MAEQTFKSPGFFEREIEVISRPLTRNSNTPVGVIGPAKKGQAFVPKTVTSVDEFIKEFGMPDQDTTAAHAIAEYFSNGGKAATFCRVLGTGSSSKTGDVGYAGFKIEGTELTGNVETDRAHSAVHFLVASHKISAEEHVTYGIFNDNDSLSTSADRDVSEDNTVSSNSDKIQLVRAMIFLKSGYTLRIGETSGTDDSGTDDLATATNGLFRLFVKASTDAGVVSDSTEYIVSLDPDSDQYITKVLNTDSFSFNDKGHFVYADFPVDESLASTSGESVAVVRGFKDNSVNFLNEFGDFSARFEAPQTTSFISQPFGKKEYDLFHFESLDDGTYASGDYKISIADLKASTEKNYKYGTFTVQLRKIDDTDEAPIILESYSRCSLDPDASNYIARLIGDQKVSLSLDVDSDDEKRLVREGTFPSQSTRIRVVMSDDVARGEVPQESLPFGFRGIPSLRTTLHGKDGQATGDASNFMLKGKDDGNNSLVAAADATNKLLYSVLPPLPFRSKVTKGSFQNSSGQYFQEYFGQVLSSSGQKESLESVSSSLYWGLHTSKVKDITKPNNSGVTDFNPLVKSLTKFLSRNKSNSSVRFQGKDADLFNNNKFTLAKVAFPGSTVASITGTSFDAFLEAAYIRNADVGSDLYDSVNHTIKMSETTQRLRGETVDAGSFVVGQSYEIKTAGDTNFTLAGAADNNVGTVFVATAIGAGTGTAYLLKNNVRATMAKLLVEDPVKFNKHSVMAKFTAPFHGGFDGVNILDRDDFFFTDRASSTTLASESADGLQGHAAAGGYSSGLVSTLAADPMQGAELKNNAVMSYRNAVRLMTDEMVVDHNVLVIPGIRDSLITDFAARRVRDFGKAIYLMDIPHHDVEGKRIFVSSRGIASGVADVDNTSSTFDLREVDSSYVAAYFPDVMIKDSGDDENALLTNQRSIRVPSSVVALGALARTDAVAQPWFAPAGFSRGSLSNVTSLDIRLNAADRDTLYEARINPIANFPNNQFVIFGQKTTQIARTSLDRVNVRRLMINIKRRIQKIAQGLLFEQNDAATRNRFIAQASSVLADVRVKQGIEDFRVIMDNTNNTAEDVDNNRLNGRIIVVPTRAVEFIAMDFVITNSGVEFPS